MPHRTRETPGATDSNNGVGEQHGERRGDEATRLRNTAFGRLLDDLACARMSGPRRCPDTIDIFGACPIKALTPNMSRRRADRGKLVGAAWTIRGVGPRGRQCEKSSKLELGLLEMARRRD